MVTSTKVLERVDIHLNCHPSFDIAAKLIGPDVRTWFLDIWNNTILEQFVTVFSSVPPVWRISSFFSKIETLRISKYQSYFTLKIELTPWI